MPALGPDQWRALSPYLDHALEISPEERAAWLELLYKENPGLAAHLKMLLQEHDALANESFLKTDPAARPTPAQLRGQTVGAYTLESPIGQGGMGTVWLARRSDGRFTQWEIGWPSARLEDLERYVDNLDNPVIYAFVPTKLVDAIIASAISGLSRMQRTIWSAGIRTTRVALTAWAVAGYRAPAKATASAKLSPLVKTWITASSPDIAMR